MEEANYKKLQEVEQLHWWNSARRSIIDSFIRRLALPENTNILELGCGSGGNLEMLSQHGTVYGGEFNNYALSKAKERYDASKVAFCQLPGNIPFQEEEFSLIGMFDVLEHIEDDHATVKAIYERLPVGGHYIVTVPAYPFLWSEHDEQCHHFRRYTKSSLRQVLEANGLKVTRISYFNFWLFPLIALVRLLSRLSRKKKGKGDLQMQNNSVNTILKFIFGSERCLLRYVNLPFGVSLIAVAEKR